MVDSQNRPPVITTEPKMIRLRGPSRGSSAADSWAAMPITNATGRKARPDFSDEYPSTSCTK